MKKSLVFFCLLQVAVISHSESDLGITKPSSQISFDVRPAKSIALETEKRNIQKKSNKSRLSFREKKSSDKFLKRSNLDKASNKAENKAEKKTIAPFDVAEDKEIDFTDRQKQEEARLKEKSERQSDAQKKRSLQVTTELTDDQSEKIQSIKKGFQKLQDDLVVIDVFKQLGMHADFIKVMDLITRKADEQVTLDDQQSVQSFLNTLVSKKDLFQNIDSKTVDMFVGKLSRVLQEHFSELSPKELADFFSQVSTMKKEAFNTHSKKSGSSISERKNLGKGMMSSQGDIFGIMMGMSFIGAIFEFITQMANQN
jgi:hypothetical protein